MEALVHHQRDETSVGQWGVRPEDRKGRDQFNVPLSALPLPLPIDIYMLIFP